MILTLLRDICRPHVIDIIMLLKRGPGMSVNELSAAMRMSYMGVKQHCIYLEKKGYLQTWRRPKPAGGRPEKMYRVSPKMDGLFPHSEGELALDLVEAAQAGIGEEATLRMLQRYFERKTERYLPVVKGRSLVDRAQSLAKQRLADGFLSFCEFDAHEGLRLLEYHSPILTLVRRIPIAIELESHMIAKVLRCQVERVDSSIEHITRIEFRLRANSD